MADFAKRPEVTVSTMGKVHNPSGAGVCPVSSQARAKASKCAAAVNASKTDTMTVTSSSSSSSSGVGGVNGGVSSATGATAGRYQTKVGKEGTAKRNIVRKKTNERDAHRYDSSHKKQGGHGKGQWRGDWTVDPYAVVREQQGDVVIDEDDPIYDQTEDTQQYILTSGGSGGAMVSSVSETEQNDQHHTQRRGIDPGTAKAVYGPLLTRCEFKVQLMECLKEYFDSSDADEVIRTLGELGCQEYHPDIVKKAISLSLDKEPRERELTSRLLTCLHPTPLSLQDIEDGFLSLLDSLEDLSKDVPEAPTMLSTFLARAVVDEVLPPAFLSEQNNERPGDVVIEKAVTMLSREHCTARLERAWGPGDGRSVDDLKKEMDQLLEEYLLSRELDEAARCVRELCAPHFHHELVKRGVFAAMVRDGKESVASSPSCENIDAMAALFGFLVSNAIVSENQVLKGVDRLHKLLPDLSLDVPTAPALLEAFEGMAKESSCLPRPTRKMGDDAGEAVDAQKSE